MGSPKGWYKPDWNQQDFPSGLSGHTGSGLCPWHISYSQLLSTRTFWFYRPEAKAQESSEWIISARPTESVLLQDLQKSLFLPSTTKTPSFPSELIAINLKASPLQQSLCEPACLRPVVLTGVNIWPCEMALKLLRAHTKSVSRQAQGCAPATLRWLLMCMVLPPDKLVSAKVEMYLPFICGGKEPVHRHLW